MPKPVSTCYTEINGSGGINDGFIKYAGQTHTMRKRKWLFCSSDFTKLWPQTTVMEFFFLSCLFWKAFDI